MISAFSSATRDIAAAKSSIFKPQEHAVAIGRVIRITDRPVAVFDLKTVQLEDQRTIRDPTPIFRIAARALTAEETLVPPAARFDIGHRDERLRTHQNLRRRTTYRGLLSPAWTWRPSP